MNPVFLFLSSGEALYPGGALLVLATSLSLFRKNSLRLLSNVAAWIGLILMILSATPIPPAGIAFFFLCFGIWYLSSNTVLGSRFRPVAVITLAAITIAICVSESTHRKIPHLCRPPDNHVVVIGDSISAGIDSRTPAWPVLLQQKTGIQVSNVSAAGATTREAVALAGQLTAQDRLVVLEIGGNDLISGAPVCVFAQSLEKVLATISVPGRTVIMMELPLLPQWIGYGQVQRRLARKYSVYLIPKCYFADVLSGANATSDGLHLAEEGSRRMAQLMAQVLDVSVEWS